MTPTITQHIPNFVSGIDPVIWHFRDRNELLNIDFVQRWTREDFYQFSVADYYDCLLLIAELEGGHKWYVVGYVRGINKDHLELPEWEKPKEKLQ